MYLKNINFIDGLSLVFSTLNTHSVIHRRFTSEFMEYNDIAMSGAGFAYIMTNDEDEFESLSFDYKSTSLGVENDKTEIKISEFKYLTCLVNGEYVLSNKSISERSIDLGSGAISIIEKDSMFCSTYYIKYSGKNENINQVLGNFVIS